MSKLWTSFEANFRSSMAYQALSVIIRSVARARAPLPVLTIGAGDDGPQVAPRQDVGPPQITSLTLPQGHPSARANGAAFQLAPVATLPAADVSRMAPDDAVSVTLGMRPRIRPGQRVEPMLGGAFCVAPLRVAAADAATFVFGDIPAGDYPLRPRVDGVESWRVQRAPPAVAPDFSLRRRCSSCSRPLTVPA
jgi:hypothetical protein